MKIILNTLNYRENEVVRVSKLKWQWAGRSKGLPLEWRLHSMKLKTDRQPRNVGRGELHTERKN